MNFGPWALVGCRDLSTAIVIAAVDASNAQRGATHHGDTPIYGKPRMGNNNQGTLTHLVIHSPILVLY